MYEDWFVDCAERGSFLNEEVFELKDGMGIGLDGVLYSFVDGFCCV